MKQYLIGAAVASLAAFAAPASASSVVDGSCISVSDSAGCRFSGNINSNGNGNANSYVSAQNAYNAYNDTHPSANPDILLNILAASDDADFSDYGTFTYDMGSQDSGTWNLDGYLVEFYAVKASDGFVLYKLDQPASSGTWNTDDMDGHDLSHLVFFGSPGENAVPEPATWAMMIAGFGLVGGAMRRRKMTVRFA